MRKGRGRWLPGAARCCATTIRNAAAPTAFPENRKRIVGGKRMRTLKSTGPGGEVLIENGRLTANGQAIDRQEKCKD